MGAEWPCKNWQYLHLWLVSENVQLLRTIAFVHGTDLAANAEYYDEDAVHLEDKMRKIGQEVTIILHTKCFATEIPDDNWLGICVLRATKTKLIYITAMLSSFSLL